MLWLSKLPRLVGVLAFSVVVCLGGTGKNFVRVSADGHHLERVDGTAFFYLADTAWNLANLCSAEDVDFYLRNRAEKGFTAVQPVVLAPDGGLDKPNVQGDLPFEGGDVNKPNERFFAHIDHIVRKAGELGMVTGLLPTWGYYWKVSEKETPFFDVAKAKAFGLYLGKRYKEADLIWILGGDQDVGSAADRAVMDAMAAGLREGDGGAHLIAYHPRGPGQSSDSLQDAAWLDVHMSQSSHGGHDHDNGLFSERDWGRKPARPTIDAEPRYECMPVGFYFTNMDRCDRFDDYDMRQAAYWSLLAGACGHTYGNNNVWQFWKPGRESVLSSNIPWREALDTPGAAQMRFVRRLFESHPFNKLQPDQSLIVDGPAHGGAKIRAARASDYSYAYFYSPRGEPFTVNKRDFPAKRMREIWYDTRYGTFYTVHVTSSHSFQTFTPPTKGRGQDWVLIIEDEAQFAARP